MPHVRAAPKNQILSLRIGPPTLSALSKILLVRLPVDRPRALRPSSRLLLSNLSLVNSPLAMNLKVLPPSLGTMFMTGPSELVSADMPLVLSTISSTTAALTW